MSVIAPRDFKVNANKKNLFKLIQEEPQSLYALLTKNKQRAGYADHQGCKANVFQLLTMSLKWNILLVNLILRKNMNFFLLKRKSVSVLDQRIHTILRVPDGQNTLETGALY
jgi:hypothetical protein